MKLVFLGDSLTWGGYGGNFVDEVAKDFPDDEIINAGVGGDTVVNLLRRLEDVIESHKPDAIFVMVGGNDATSYSMPDTRGYYRKTKELENGMVTPQEFETSYRELLSQIQLNYIQALVGLAPSEYSKEIVTIKHEYNLLARKVAETMNIPILDLDAEFSPENPIEREPVNLKFIQDIGANVAKNWDKFEEERAKWGYEFTFDGMHILPETAKEFAKLIVPFIKTHVS